MAFWRGVRRRNRIRETTPMKTGVMTGLATACLLAAPVAAQEVHQLAGADVAVYTLAGRVQVVRGTAADVVVRITRGGAGASQLRIETGPIAGRSTLRVVFPDDEIVYPAMGRRSSTTMSVRADGTFGDGNGRSGDRVRVRGSGSGLEAWADLVDRGSRGTQPRRVPGRGRDGGQRRERQPAPGLRIRERHRHGHHGSAGGRHRVGAPCA
jgi:hypothetical protein